jgi:hypothetical protein
MLKALVSIKDYDLEIAAQNAYEFHREQLGFMGGKVLKVATGWRVRVFFKVGTYASGILPGGVQEITIQEEMMDALGIV